METQSGNLAPNKLIHAGLHPAEIQKSITTIQSSGLAFASRDFKVVNAVVKTYQTGTSSSGTVSFGGLNVALGGTWGAFGGVGAINQRSINLFKTDIQLKLEDAVSGEKVFIATSIPFEMTLSIDPGESVCLYYTKGGLLVPKSMGDFYLAAWIPFVAKNLNTGQIIPLRAVPTLLPPKDNNAGLVLTILGGAGVLFYFSIGIANAQEGGMWLFVSCLVLALGIILFLNALFAKKKWRKEVLNAEKAAKNVSIVAQQ